MRLESERETLADGERYDILIQSLEQQYLDDHRNKDELQRLRRELYTTMQPQPPNKDYNISYYKKIPDAQFVETLADDGYFDIEINKLDDENDKNNLQYLRKKTFNIYNDAERDYYYVNLTNKEYQKVFDSKCLKIENVEDFVNKTIKKNVIYKLIRNIFHGDETAIRAACEMVKDINDDVYVIKFFKTLRRDISPGDFRNRFDKVLKDYFDEQSDEKRKNKKRNFDEKEEKE
ncbi:hypothetical protein C2G38_2045401 [Gigaspora rosea]|uniref:Uncharacterized protein n=1 Tax=Gigaspora rosea TaxID=44941 RepID=A0A397UL90_9GLOM|nr:hypothetical protein C2G38_2045401 [Gigaspora rosea]